jgi:hypothetical protein
MRIKPFSGGEGLQRLPQDRCWAMAKRYELYQLVARLMPFSASHVGAFDAALEPLAVEVDLRQRSLAFVAKLV